MNIKVFTTSICLIMLQTLFAGWGINVIQAVESEKPSTCVIETVKSEEAWEHCLDKFVQLQGIHASPEKIRQHPTVIAQIPQQTEDSVKSRQYQDYLEVGGQQIILITQVEIPCENAMEVSGLLKKIDLGGQKGTKGEYKNWIVEVSHVNCINAIEH